MEKFKIEISSTAEKALKKIPKKDLVRIVSLIQTLAINPFPSGCKKLSGEEETFRIRQGNYRIIYEIRKNKLLILILKIGHRKEIRKEVYR